MSVLRTIGPLVLRMVCTDPTDILKSLAIFPTVYHAIRSLT